MERSATIRTSRLRPAQLVLAVALAALVLPAVAGADVRFAPALTSSASDPGVSAQNGVVAGNAAGDVVSAYAQKTDGVDRLYARIKPAGVAAFGAAADIGGANADAPAAAVAADGTVTVAWMQASPCAGSSVWIATAPPGAVFGPAAKVSDNAYYPRLAVGPDGTVLLLYGHDKGSCVHEERAQVRPRTGAPTDVVISDPGYGSVADADIGVDANGTATAAFVQSLSVTPYTRVLRVARRPAGGAWTGTTLSGPGTEGSALAVAPDGSAVVADNTKIPDGYAVEVRSRAAGATVFGAPQTVTDTTANDTLSGVAISNGGAAAVTTAHGRATVRPPGAVAFDQAAPIGLPVSAANLLPAFTGQGELVLFDSEHLADESDFALVARVRQPGTGGALGAPQATGLTSVATGAASLTSFGANDVAAGWSNKPTGTTTFSAGVALGDGTPPKLGATSAPSGGLAGAPLSFAVTPTDNLGIAGVQWAFGDGATATDAATTHAFAAAGASNWSVVATDLAGNSATAAGDLTIQPQQQLQPVPLAVAITKPRRGTRAQRLAGLRGTASGPVSRVEVAVVRLLHGAKASAATARARVACASLSAAGRLATPPRSALHTRCRPGRYLKASGTSRWMLRLRHRLPAGHYAVWARARSSSGAKSAVVRATFTLR